MYIYIHIHINIRIYIHNGSSHKQNFNEIIKNDKMIENNKNSNSNNENSNSNNKNNTTKIDVICHIEKTAQKGKKLVRKLVLNKNLVR